MQLPVQCYTRTGQSSPCMDQRLVWYGLCSTLFTLSTLQITEEGGLLLGNLFQRRYPLRVVSWWSTKRRVFFRIPTFHCSWAQVTTAHGVRLRNNCTPPHFTAVGLCRPRALSSWVWRNWDGTASPYILPCTNPESSIINYTKTKTSLI